MSHMKEAEWLCVRWMIRVDLPRVLEIERESYSNPWNEEQFIDALRRQDTIGMTIEVNKRVEGFMVYNLHRVSIELLTIAVAKDKRRQGLGSEMIDKLAQKLNDRRRYIICSVHERNLAAQLFFKSRGMTARIIHDYYQNGDDAYHFTFRNEIGEACYGA